MKDLDKKRKLGVILIFVGMAVFGFHYLIDGSDVKDFVSGVLLGISIAEMLIGIFMIGMSISNRG